MKNSNLGTWIPVYDDFGDVVYYYDDITGAYMDSSGSLPIDQVVHTQGNAPPADPIAAGINPDAIISVAGALYKYIQTRNNAGQVTYTPVPYGQPATGGLNLSNPLVLAAAALAAFALLS